MLPKHLEEFIRAFSRLPGIGAKTAERLGYYLISAPNEVARDLAQAVVSLSEKTMKCSQCGNISDSDPCHICGGLGRDTHMICVVESSMDIVSIEDTGSYKGLFHVLEGLISPLEGVTPDDLRLSSLLKRVKEEGITEIILGLSATTEGDTTAMYIQDMLKELDVKISHLARGIPIGTDIQYAGKGSLKTAIEHREMM